MLVVSAQKFSLMASKIEKVLGSCFFFFEVSKIITYIAVTGASFVIIDGALKDSGEPFDVNILEVSSCDIYLNTG